MYAPLPIPWTDGETLVLAHPGLVVLRTEIGGSRILNRLPGDQLPRIC